LTKKKVINLFFATKKNKFITLKSYNKQLQKFTFFSHNYLKNYLLSDEKNNKNAFFFKHKKKKIKFLINKINQSKFKNLKLNFSRNKLVKKNLTKLNFFLTNFAIHFKEINQK
jgi:hypothetical protein